MDTEILLNDFATRSFRNIADQDYVAARLSYRHSLIPQFHWQSLQAIEKYFKAILLYNRIKARDVNHDLARALKHCKKLPFEIQLSESTHELIKHLDNFGRFRYLEVSYFLTGPKLVQLDKAVWELRRYCRVLNYSLTLSDGTVKNMLSLEIDKIERAGNAAPHKFRISGGELEKILEKADHPSRGALIWQNAFFASRSRKKVRTPVYFHGVNAPLSLHPEVLDAVLGYIFIPKEVVDAYREANK